MSGRELFETLIKNSGLPEAYVRPRLEKLLVENGWKLETLTVENVRDMLSNLLLDLINESELTPTQECLKDSDA